MLLKMSPNALKLSFVSKPDNFCHAVSLFTDASYVYASLLNDTSGLQARILRWQLRMV